MPIRDQMSIEPRRIGTGCTTATFWITAAVLSHKRSECESLSKLLPDCGEALKPREVTRIREARRRPNCFSEPFPTAEPRLKIRTATQPRLQNPRRLSNHATTGPRAASSSYKAQALHRWRGATQFTSPQGSSRRYSSHPRTSSSTLLQEPRRGRHRRQLRRRLWAFHPAQQTRKGALAATSSTSPGTVPSIQEPR